jgi:hypothetical protein
MQLYKLDFPNGKSYIGITSRTAQKRFVGHIASSRNRPRGIVSFAIGKYGSENVALTVLGECDNWELLCLAEIEAIEMLNTKSPNGYNLTDGGDGCLGRQKTAEEIEKIRRANLGRKATDEAKSNMRKGRLKILNERPEIAKNHSEFMKIHMNKPENREKNSSGSKLRFSTDSARNEAAQKTKDYFKNNPEMKDHLSKKNKEWAINNPEKEAERQAKATKTRTSLEKRTEMQAVKLLAANEQMKVKLMLLPESERAKAEIKMLKTREYNARKREKRNRIKFT